MACHPVRSGSRSRYGVRRPLVWASAQSAHQTDTVGAGRERTDGPHGFAGTARFLRGPGGEDRSEQYHRFLVGVITVGPFGVCLRPIGDLQPLRSLAGGTHRSITAGGTQVTGLHSSNRLLPGWIRPRTGDASPDVSVTIDMDHLAESGWPASHTVEATFTVIAGNGAPGCRNSYVNHLTPPLVQFDWNGTLRHTSTMTGVNSSAAKYKLVAEGVAKQIAGGADKRVQRTTRQGGSDTGTAAGILPALPTAARVAACGVRQLGTRHVLAWTDEP